MDCNNEVFNRTPSSIDQETLRRHIENIPSFDLRIHPTVDVHTHTHELTNELLKACNPKWRPLHRPPKKTALSESTWALVLEKKATRNDVFWWLYNKKLLLIRVIFTAWKSSQRPTTATLQDLKDHDFEIAKLWHAFGRLSRRVTNAVRADSRAFFDSLADKTGDLDDGKFSKDFWLEIRKHLPQMKKRRAGFAPLQMEELVDQWIPHFSQLESGQTVEPEQHLTACFERQQKARETIVKPKNLEDLPSILETEKHLRNTRPGRAPGPEGLSPGCLHWAAPKIAAAVHMLFVKIFTQSAEPILFKGGSMIPIYKKSSPLIANNYRGIMLIPVLSKAFQAVLRSRLVPELAKSKPQGLLGGFPRQCVSFGSQSTRVFNSIARELGYSATLYIDMKHAYHHLIRALSLGRGAYEQDFNYAISQLHQTCMKEGCCNSVLEETPIVKAFEGTPLLGLLQEIHVDTFFMIQNKWVRTARGSRPGSPLADMVFAGLMLKLHRIFDELLRNDPDISQATSSMRTITWGDDVTLEIACIEAARVVPVLQRIASATFNLLIDHGLSVNLTPGKTSAVLALRGTGAPELRREWLQLQQSCPVNTKAGEVQLPLMSNYTHLGVLSTAAGSIVHEIQHRIGQTQTAFATIKKPIIGNGRLRHKTRCALVDTVLLSKLFFGCGAWDVLPGQLQARLDHFVAKLY